MATQDEIQNVRERIADQAILLMETWLDGPGIPADWQVFDDLESLVDQYKAMVLYPTQGDANQG